MSKTGGASAAPFDLPLDLTLGPTSALLLASALLAPALLRCGVVGVSSKQAPRLAEHRAAARAAAQGAHRAAG